MYSWTFSFEIWTESSYLLCFITESKIIMETNKNQVAFSTVQKLSSKIAKIFFKEYCSLPFCSSFGHFWSVYILILNQQCDTEGVCNVCKIWKLCSIPILSNGTVTNHYRPYWINTADCAKVSATPSGHNIAVQPGLPDALCWIHWKQYHCSFTGQSQCLLPILPLFISNTNTEIIWDPSTQSSHSIQVKCSPRLAHPGKTNLSWVRTRCIKSAVTKLLFHTEKNH